jgi:hypothetical protein
VVCPKGVRKRPVRFGVRYVYVSVNDVLNATVAGPLNVSSDVCLTQKCGDGLSPRRQDGSRGGRCADKEHLQRLGRANKKFPRLVRFILSEMSFRILDVVRNNIAVITGESSQTSAPPFPPRTRDRDVKGRSVCAPSCPHLQAPMRT